MRRLVETALVIAVGLFGFAAEAQQAGSVTPVVPPASAGVTTTDGSNQPAPTAPPAAQHFTPPPQSAIRAPSTNSRVLDLELGRVETYPGYIPPEMRGHR